LGSSFLGCSTGLGEATGAGAATGALTVRGAEGVTTRTGAGLFTITGAAAGSLSALSDGISMVEGMLNTVEGCEGRGLLGLAAGIHQIHPTEGSRTHDRQARDHQQTHARGGRLRHRRHLLHGHLLHRHRGVAVTVVLGAVVLVLGKVLYMMCPLV
jgi:hypothetical protein